MKAAQYKKYGGPDVIELVEVEKPEISSSHILVENFASSINPFDFKVRNGWIPGLPKEFPATIGGDFSGKVVEVGKEVSEYKIHDEIYGQASIFGGGSGSMAEFVSVLPKSVSLKPNTISFEEAASLPLVACSAVQAIHDYISLKPNEIIFINGGSGGIGSIAIQIAKFIGAKIITTVSSQNIEFVKSLGADQVIDYKKEKYWELVEDVDCIFDVSGKSVDENLYKILKRRGILVSMNDISESFSHKYDIKAIAQNSQVTTERLTKVTEYIEKNIIKPEIEKVFNLSDISKAYSYQENQKLRGKVVIKIK